jgi:hypothetical protein
VADSSLKKTWTTPAVNSFAGPEEIWNHYRDRFPPKELEGLRTFLRVNYGFDPESRELPRRRA